MAAPQGKDSGCSAQCGLARLPAETLALVLERLPAAADRAALRASCKPMRDALNAAVKRVAIALWRWGYTTSDEWGAPPSELPALLERHPNATALVFLRTQHTHEDVNTLTVGIDMDDASFINSAGLCNKEDASALQELLWEWVGEGLAFPGIMSVEGCPYTCLSPTARLFPSIKTLTAVVFETSAITVQPLPALKLLTALETLHITAERGNDGQPGTLLCGDCYNTLAASAPQLRSLQLEFQQADMDTEYVQGVFSCDFASALTALTSLRLMHGGIVMDDPIVVTKCKDLRELVITGLQGDAATSHLPYTLQDIGEAGGLAHLTRFEGYGADLIAHGPIAPNGPVLGPSLAGCTALVRLWLPVARVRQAELEALATALPGLQELALLSFNAPPGCAASFPRLQELSCKAASGWQLPLALLAPELRQLHVRHGGAKLRAELLSRHAHLTSLSFDAGDLPALVGDGSYKAAKHVQLRHLAVLGSIDASKGPQVQAFKALCCLMREPGFRDDLGLSFCSRDAADELVAIAAAEASPQLQRLEVAYAHMPRGEPALRRMLYAMKSFQFLEAIRIQEGYDDGRGGWVLGRACMRPAHLELLCDAKGWSGRPTITLAGVRGVRRADVQRLRAAAGGRIVGVVLEPAPQWVL